MRSPEAPNGLWTDYLIPSQIVGPQWVCAEVLGIAHAYEEATPEIRAARPLCA